MGTRHLYWILTGPSFAVGLDLYLRVSTGSCPVQSVEQNRRDGATWSKKTELK
jgi:hypothetical protein